MDRQSAHIAAVIPRARAAGYTHILHVDDDKLIYCANGVGALLAEMANAPEGRPDLHMHNVEAVFPSDDCDNPFREARALLPYVRDIVTPLTSSYSVMRMAPIPPPRPLFNSAIFTGARVSSLPDQVRQLHQRQVLREARCGGPEGAWPAPFQISRRRRR